MKGNTLLNTTCIYVSLVTGEKQLYNGYVMLYGHTERTKPHNVNWLVGTIEQHVWG